jgi:hypothetical protein
MSLVNAVGALGLVGMMAGATADGTSAAFVMPLTLTTNASRTTLAADEQAAPVNPRGAATKAFLDRIAEYIKFHNNVQKTVPPLDETADPAKISAREKALGEMLIKMRPNAKQGDFFIKEYQPFLAEIIKEDFAKRSLADRKALIVELPKGVKVGVNQFYPTTLPLATFPPNLLKVLPDLPPELEYRIVGRDLILRDVKGNVVVDIMPNVFSIPV